MNPEEVMSNNFNFNNFGADFKIHIDINNEAQCPECKGTFKHLPQHLRFNKACRANIDYEAFKDAYKVFTRKGEINT